MGENMDVQALIIWLIVGAIAGWLAGMVVKGGGCEVQLANTGRITINKIRHVICPNPLLPLV